MFPFASRTTSSASSCPDCIDGHRNGTKFERAGIVSEVVLLGESADPYSKPLQEQIEDLARRARDRQQELRRREREVKPTKTKPAKKR
jgi:hypothetical protein